jgi:hypothetical protein
MTAPLADELLAASQEVAHLLRRFVRDEAASDQPMCHQIGQPSDVIDVGLAARHVLDMRGVRQHQFELAVCKNMPYRLPVNARRFHGDMRAAFGRQPFRQRHEILGRRLERPDLPLYRAVHHMARASHHCIPRFREGRLL